MSEPAPLEKTGKESKSLHGWKLWKVVLLAALIRGVMKLLGMTLRIDFEDANGWVTNPEQNADFADSPGRDSNPPLIWVFWHNRILVVPEVYRRFAFHRKGAVLTSASSDGEILARVVAGYGLDSVRGSTSKRGRAAMVALLRYLRSGKDIAITPDGPRGPKYHVHGGVVQLARLSGANILPISVEMESAWRLRSWDGFFIPKPFSKVRVRFEPIVEMDDSKKEKESEESIEKAREALRNLLLSYTKTQ